MIKYCDLKGVKVGMLNVIELSEDKFDSNGTTKLWKCECECGNIVYRSARIINEAIKKQKNFNCGCSVYVNYTNQKFGDLTVKRKIKINNISYYECICVCGKTIYKRTYEMKNLNYVCKEKNKEKSKTREKLRGIYYSMKRRCYDIKNKSYKDYGGRGIKVCDEWLGEKGFENFYKWSLENNYAKNLSLDRVNNDGNYEPNNCKWSTRIEQANNKRTNIIIKYKNEEKTLKQWCRELNLKYRSIHKRIFLYKWDVEKAFTKKLKGA